MKLPCGYAKGFNSLNLWLLADLSSESNMDNDEAAREKAGNRSLRRMTFIKLSLNTVQCSTVEL